MLIGQSLPIQQLTGDLERKLPAHKHLSLLLVNQVQVKKLLPNLVHRLSNRNEGPFIAINCGAIPTDLMESELFGP